MIRLDFVGDVPIGSVTLGPAPWFRIAGNFVRQGPEGVIVGTYRKHEWEVQGQHFTSYDGNDRTAIHFEDAAGGPSEDFGPFGHFFVADGTMYAEGKLFAKFMEESQLWHCYLTDTYWPVMVIKPAAVPGA